MSPALSSELARLRQERRLARDAWVTIWGLRSVHQFLRLPPAATADLEAMSLREAQPRALSARSGSGPSIGCADDRCRRSGRHASPARGLADRSCRGRDRAPDSAARRCWLQRARRVHARDGTHGRRASSRARRHQKRPPHMWRSSRTRCAWRSCATECCSSLARFPGSLPILPMPYDERLADELRRSLLFFRQSFRAVVERVVLCGGMPNLRALTSSTGSALNVPVETLDSLSGIDAEVVPEPADTFRATVAALWPAIAIASQGGDQPNLLRAATRVAARDAARRWCASRPV